LTSLQDAVMVAVPGLTAVTVPLASTVATEGLLLRNVILLTVLRYGGIVPTVAAESFRVLPAYNVADVCDRAMRLTRT